MSIIKATSYNPVWFLRGTLVLQIHQSNPWFINLSKSSCKVVSWNGLKMQILNDFSNVEVELILYFSPSWHLSPIWVFDDSNTHVNLTFEVVLYFYVIYPLSQQFQYHRLVSTACTITRNIQTWTRSFRENLKPKWKYLSTYYQNIYLIFLVNRPLPSPSRQPFLYKLIDSREMPTKKLCHNTIMY